MKKSIYNLLSGFGGQLISILLGIVIPRLILKNLGSEVNGLMSSANQALQYLALLEAGVGTATIQALYGPVAVNDKNEINRILAATNIYYKKTSLYYLCGVFAFSIIYTIAVKTELSPLVVLSTILLSGIPGVINFYFQGKYRLLLQAEGKNYVLSNLTTAVHVFVNITKIILLNSGFGIIAIQTSYCLYSLVQMCFILWYIRKKYSWLNIDVQPDLTAISQKKHVLVHQIASLIFNNTDVLMLTFFCGLKTVSVYSLYSLLFGMIGTSIATVNSSVIFKLGQTFNTDKRRFLILFDIFESYNMSLTFSLYTVANIFILPFLKLYTDGINDINYIDKYLPWLFIATYLLSNGRTSSNQVINFAAHFKQTQKRAIVESIINLFVTVIGIYFMGIYGALLGTMVALFYRANDMIVYSAKYILHRRPVKTYKRWIVNIALFITISCFGKKMLGGFTSYTALLLSAMVSSIIIISLYLIIDSLIDLDSTKNAVNIFKNVHLLKQ